jgi:hypothetical protein
MENKRSRSLSDGERFEKMKQYRRLHDELFVIDLTNDDVTSIEEDDEQLASISEKASIEPVTSVIRRPSPQYFHRRAEASNERDTETSNGPATSDDKTLEITDEPVTSNNLMARSEREEDRENERKPPEIRCTMHTMWGDSVRDFKVRVYHTSSWKLITDLTLPNKIIQQFYNAEKGKWREVIFSSYK